jgi:hypothetical protein
VAWPHFSNALSYAAEKFSISQALSTKAAIFFSSTGISTVKPRGTHLAVVLQNCCASNTKNIVLAISLYAVQIYW